MEADTLAALVCALEFALVMGTACLLPLVVSEGTLTEDQSMASSTSTFETQECLYRLQVLQKVRCELKLHFEAYDYCHMYSCEQRAVCSLEPR